MFTACFRGHCMHIIARTPALILPQGRGGRYTPVSKKFKTDERGGKDKFDTRFFSSNMF